MYARLQVSHTIMMNSTCWIHRLYTRKSSQVAHYMQHSKTRTNPTLTEAEVVIQTALIIAATTTTGRATTAVTTVVTQTGGITTRTAALIVTHTGTMATTVPLLFTGTTVKDGGTALREAGAVPEGTTDPQSRREATTILRRMEAYFQGPTHPQHYQRRL